MEIQAPTGQWLEAPHLLDHQPCMMWQLYFTNVHFQGKRIIPVLYVIFFFFCLVSSLYPSDDYVLSSIRITILINMQEKFLLENLALCFVKDYQTEQPRSLY